MNSNQRCGIVLAGGRGTRLWPATRVVSKQLFAVYDKPLIYYPLATLAEIGIRDILIITTRESRSAFERVLGDGSQFGLRFSFASQAEPRGIAEALLIGADFIGTRSVALILGDNVFYGASETIRKAVADSTQATIFTYPVTDPERYGVIVFDVSGQPTQIVEKPTSFLSSHAVTGLYAYDSSVVDIANQLQPSSRGELEITDVNRAYLERGDLSVVRLGRGSAWLDTGTADSLLEAANFIATIERRQGTKIACLEEIAYRQGYVTVSELQKLADQMPAGDYRAYIESVINEG